jgi:hypothetical protein
MSVLQRFFVPVAAGAFVGTAVHDGIKSLESTTHKRGGERLSLALDNATQGGIWGISFVCMICASPFVVPILFIAEVGTRGKK